MAKAKDETPDSELEQLRATVAQQAEALASQQATSDRMLDLMVEMQAKLEEKTAAPVKATSEPERLRQELDAELEALVDEFKDFEAIDVAARRAEAGTNASLEIRLKDEPDVAEDPTGTNRKWFLYWANFGKENRSQDIKNKGFVRVRRDELRDPEGLGVLAVQDEFVRRGDRGLEVLHKQPLKLHLYLKRREQLAREGLLGSESALRDHLANSTAAKAREVGDNADQAGSFVHSPTFRVSLTDGPTERVTI